ncbi:MAG TPA: glycosyltransferase family 4 protein [Acidimicrobiia bacterium]|nr:glycosyltransferase family 4 protein [Acidimicrobiia bacterium]
MTSLLVTNDFPPKMGGIQSYLYELWRRLPSAETHVLTTSFAGSSRWDAAQSFDVERARRRVLLPTPGLRRRVDAIAGERGADVVFLDPMLPLGVVGPRLRAAPYVVIAHGAEVNVPGRLPGGRVLARRVLRSAAGLVAAGEYPARVAAGIAGVALPTLVVPPGVDADRFRPLGTAERSAARNRFGLAPDRPLVLGLSRLVPRKGFDVLIDAVAGLDREVQLAIGGAGRDARRLQRRAAARGITGRCTFLGRVSDPDLPALYGCADVFAMLCRERWAGLEAEGFGIVFVEAAACGVPSVAGRSGGSHEAVVDGETGFVVDPHDLPAVRAALQRLLSDDGLRTRLGRAARARAVEELTYDRQVARLLPVTRGDLDALARFRGDA